MRSCWTVSARRRAGYGEIRRLGALPQRLDAAALALGAAGARPSARPSRHEPSCSAACPNGTRPLPVLRRALSRSRLRPCSTGWPGTDRRGCRTARRAAGLFRVAATHAFDPRHHKDAPNMLLAEAGTGIGKTLGYLAPASLWAEEADGAVWISTYTKALQRQLVGEATARLSRSAAVQGKGRRPQGARELSLPAQSGRCAARRLCRARGDPCPSGRALGRLYRRWRHGRRRSARLAAHPVPPQRFDRADRPARRVHLCRLPALPQMLHRTRQRASAQAFVIANHALMMVNAARGREEANRPTRYHL
jgi:Rad3-related DNA helicase